MKRVSRIHQEVGIVIPLMVYTITSSLTSMAVQSLIYIKECYSIYENPILCDNRTATHSDIRIQTAANHALFLADVAFIIPSLPLSIIIGSISDTFSRKFAMLIPYIACVLSDTVFLVTASYQYSSTALIYVAQVILGLGGGYAPLFAYMADTAKSENIRSIKMALSEGSLSLGKLC